MDPIATGASPPGRLPRGTLGNCRPRPRRRHPGRVRRAGPRRAARNKAGAVPGREGSGPRGGPAAGRAQPRGDARVPGGRCRLPAGRGGPGARGRGWGLGAEGAGGRTARLGPVLLLGEARDGGRGSPPPPGHFAEAGEQLQRGDRSRYSPSRAPLSKSRWQADLSARTCPEPPRAGSRAKRSWGRARGWGRLPPRAASGRRGEQTQSSPPHLFMAGMAALEFVLVYLLYMVWCNPQGTQATGNLCAETRGDRAWRDSEGKRATCTETRNPNAFRIAG